MKHFDDQVQRIQDEKAGLKQSTFMWTHNQFNRNLLEHPEADVRKRVKQCQDVSCTHLYLLHGTQKQLRWFTAQLRWFGDFAISSILNFFCPIERLHHLPQWISLCIKITWGVLTIPVLRPHATRIWLEALEVESGHQDIYNICIYIYIYICIYIYMYF